MKVIAALLLGLISSTFADSVVLEFESPDSAEVGSDESVSYNGIIIQVRQGTDSAPTIALGSDLDDYDDVYCLNFVGLFEASQYDVSTTTSGSYTEIDNTRFDLADANCTTFEEGAGVFTIKCSDIGAATLFLTFTFVEDAEGDSGLEYIIKLEDYELSDDTANLVMVQSVSECGDVIDIDAESEEEDESSSTITTEEPDVTSSADDTATTGQLRRLLQDESTSTEEPESMEGTEDEETEDEETDESASIDEDGISSDESSEFELGFARFVVSGQALDRCGDVSTEINSTLVFQRDDDELHIVFAPFNCTLILDPFYGLDNSKYELVYGDTATPSTTEDNAQSFTILVASIIGLFAYLW